MTLHVLRGPALALAVALLSACDNHNGNGGPDVSLQVAETATQLTLTLADPTDQDALYPAPPTPGTTPAVGATDGWILLFATQPSSFTGNYVIAARTRRLTYAGAIAGSYTYTATLPTAALSVGVAYSLLLVPDSHDAETNPTALGLDYRRP